MINKKYSEDFEKLWKAFDIVTKLGLGQKGAKTKAYEVFRAKKCDSDDVEYLIKCVYEQIRTKINMRKKGQFDPDFQHCERWLRNERYSDVIEQPELREAIRPASRRDQAREAIAALTGEGETNSDGAGETGFLRLVERP